MLSSLHIRNYILIDSLDISFPEGLVIITGQTGAGKSILLGALSLLSGARADASAIGPGSDNCVVEAEFDGAPEELRPILEDNDLDWNGGSFLVRRVVSSAGRSRSFVNDCPASVGVLQSIFERLVDVHSQHRSLLVTDRGFQLSVLDFFAGNADKVRSCRSLWKELKSAESELTSLKERHSRLGAEADYNMAQFRQLSDAGLKEGELEELEQEQKSLAAAEQIKGALARSLDIFDPVSEENHGLTGALKDLGHCLELAGRYIPSIAELSSRVDSVRIELDDVRSEIDAANSRMDLSEDRLAAVEERLSLLYTLMKRHECRDIASLMEVRDRFGESVDGIGDLDDRIRDLEKEVSRQRAAYDSLCMELSQARKAAAGPFADNILDSLHFLELDRAVFVVEVKEGPETGDGRDAVSFLFSANGTSPVELSKCASGGEISRIMLCLKEMMARFVGMPTLIFDEIDTGVSGSVADKMGQMICRMGANMQVFSITHLPQVAAKGDSHYLVSKHEMGGRNISSIHRIEGRERVMEIARLLSGATVTPEAVANAESLLEGR